MKRVETYLCGLLERLLRDGNEDDAVRAKSIFSSGLHILDQVLALGKVDEGVGAQFL
jgi:hypothetical protein